MNKKIDIYIYNYLEIKIYLFILKFSDKIIYFFLFILNYLK